ncbi:DUF5131 family protein [Fibrella aestuarina]|nr:DUF5131 family protein [Fibrella aestuarina]
MGELSKIEWLRPRRADGTAMPGHTANLWWGCEHVHAGCDNCYAERWSKRYEPVGLWDKETPRRMMIKGVWDQLRSWQRHAAALGEIHRVFTGSMMDIAEKSQMLVDREGAKIVLPGGFEIPMMTADLRVRYFEQVVPATPNLEHLLLSKRPSNYNKVVPQTWLTKPPVNVMFGASVVSPKTLTLVDQLRRVKGRRFLSIEPQLELIDAIDLTGIDWVINGGESGPLRRPFNTDWARRLRDICREQGVPFFFKQVDKVLPIPDDLLIHEFPVLPYQPLQHAA